MYGICNEFREPRMHTYKHFSLPYLLIRIQHCQQNLFAVSYC